MKFTAVLESHGKTATGIEIPSSVIDKLGGGKRALIRVTIKGHTYASAIGSMNGRSLISVSADNRTKAGINAGDRVTVDVVLDTEKRDIEIPADFAKVLAKNATAKRAFDALSNSNKRRHVLSIEGAKTDETRQRRIAKALAELS